MLAQGLVYRPYNLAELAHTSMLAGTCTKPGLRLQRQRQLGRRPDPTATGSPER